MKVLKPLAVIAVVAVLLAGLLYLRPRRHEATFYPMGGIPFKVVAYGRTPSQFAGDLKAVKVRVGELVAVFNRHDEASELSRMNREAAVAPFAMSAEMDLAFDLSRKWQKETGGAFDPSVGPLVDLWKKAGEKGRLPSKEELAKAKRLVGLNLVSSTADGKILFSRDGMSLDFGAIAKGAIVDAAADVLEKRGVGRGVIEAGGDCVAFGPGWFRFGIQDPTAKAGEKLAGEIDVKEGGVVTSGNYERFEVIGGKRYSHIIDPRAGEPVDNGVVSATVVGGTSADADAVATALVVMGLADAMAFIRDQGWAKAVLIQQSPTSGLYDVWLSKELVPVIRLNDPWRSRVHIF